MTVLEHTLPFNVSAGTPDTTFRTHEGVITWARDDATQIVTMHFAGARTVGPGTGSMYIEWAVGTVPPEMWPELPQYPYIDNTSVALNPDGSGYLYVSGSLPYEGSFRYITSSPVVIPADPLPTMSSVELELNRANTTAFIAVKPSSIALVPQDKVAQPSGGYKMVDLPPRAPQTFRIIELGMHQSPPILTLTDGKQREASFWLLGEWDADMAVDDHWMGEDGREWLVGDIVRSNHYEARGLVVERGK